MGITVLSQKQESHLVNNKEDMHAKKDLSKAIRKGQLVALQTLLHEHPQVNLAAPDSQGISLWDHAVIGFGVSKKLDVLKELFTHEFGQLSSSILEFFTQTLTKLQCVGVLHAHQQVHGDIYNTSTFSGVHLAAMQGDLEQVKKEIKQDLNLQEEHAGLTPLHCAALSGNLEVLDYLLSQGAKKDLLTPLGQTALHLAASKNHLQVAKRLLEHGLSVHAQDYTYSTPLHYAMMHRDTALSKLLLEKGADPHLVNQFDLSPLEIFASWLRYEGYTKDSLRLGKADWVQFFSLLGTHLLDFAGFREWRAMSLTMDLANQFFYTSNPRNQRTISSHDSRLKYAGKKFLDTCGRVQLSTTVARLALLLCLENRYAALPAAILTELGLLASLPLIATRAYTVTKNALSNIKTAWAQTSYETYRPLRNMMVNLVEGTRVASDIASCKRSIETLEQTFKQDWQQDNSNQSNNNNDNNWSEQDNSWRNEDSWRKSWEERQKKSETLSRDSLETAPACSGQTKEALQQCILDKKLDPTKLKHAEYLFGITKEHRGDPDYCKTINKSFKKLRKSWHPDPYPEEEKPDYRRLSDTASTANKLLQDTFCPRTKMTGLRDPA